MTNIIYRENYINVSRLDLIADLKSRLKPKRFDHVLRVEKTALKLADTYQVDREQVSVASLLHDYTKDMEKKGMYELSYQWWPTEKLAGASSAIWHGPAAAQVAKTQFGCSNKSILNAIAWHTIGWHKMGDIEKIVFMADYIEPGRDFEGVEKARDLSYQNLEQAVIYQMASSINHLAQTYQPIFSESVAIYNTWIKKQTN